MNYKKTNAIASMTCLVCMLVSTAQMNGQGGEVGLRFMPTISNVSAQTSTGGVIEGEATLGYGIGLMLGYHFNEIVGVQIEGIYNTISQKYVEQDKEHKIKLKYFNIPLLMSLNTGNTKVVNFNIVGGPQIGISVGSSLETVNGNNINNEQAVLSVKKGDLGLAYGAGLDFGLNPVNTLRFSIGFRGVYGLFDISDNNRNLATDSYYLLDRTHIKTYSGYIGASFLF
ncbi:MAG: porin family protein [Flavobacteriales bacterium]